MLPDVELSAQLPLRSVARASCRLGACCSTHRTVPAGWVPAPCCAEPEVLLEPHCIAHNERPEMSQSTTQYTVYPLYAILDNLADKRKEKRKRKKQQAARKHSML